MADIYEALDRAHSAINDAYRAADDLGDPDDFDCDRTHCDDYDCECPTPTNSDAWDIARDYLRQIRMGYTLDVSIQEILEEIERAEEQQ